VAGPFVRRAGLAWYGPDAFLTEVWAAGLGAAHGGIVHFLYGENSYRYAGRLRLGGRSRLVATFHLPPSVFADYVRRTDHLEQLDVMILVGTNQLALLDRLRRRPAVFVVPHGVDTDFFRAPAQPSVDGPCLFVGQWLRDLDTLALIVEQVSRASPSARFVLVLPEHLAPAWRHRPGVQVHSNITDAALRRQYQEARLLVLPLRDCTASNSILEAMACGLPVVSMDVGGIRDYLELGCARLVPPGRPAAMTDAILDLLENPDVCASLSRRARARAEQFAWPLVAKRTLEVYESLA
jgi:glycosyltransferase involved in cell wall biosynthesis